MSLSPTINTGVSTLSGPFHRAVGYVTAALAHRIDAYYARQALRVELERLDYRSLRDVGISEYGVAGYVDTWTPGRKSH